MKNIKKRIFLIIQIGKERDIPSKVFDIILVIAILLNLFIAFFSTFACSEPYMGIMDAVEWVTVIFFSIEYLLRVWTSEFLYPRSKKNIAIIKFIFSPTGLIDFFSFFPFFLPFFFPSGLVAFRMFRVLRILRLFQINRYFDALTVITTVFKKKGKQLLSSTFIILVLMFASSLVMYSLEHEAQPDVFTNAFSGFWWACSTLLTVGYGDIYPITPIGKIVGMAVTFLGVGVVAIPTGIIFTGFVEYVSDARRAKAQADNPYTYCPHCGKRIR